MHAACEAETSRPQHSRDTSPLAAPFSNCTVAAMDWHGSARRALAAVRQAAVQASFGQAVRWAGTPAPLLHPVCGSCGRHLSSLATPSRLLAPLLSRGWAASGVGARPPAPVVSAAPGAGAALWPRGFAARAEPALKKYKPTSPGQRHRVTTSRKGLWPGKPIKELTVVRP